MQRRLWHLLVGTRGGLKRAEILHLVARRPYNAHELSRLLGVDYKTARHHLKVLVDNDLLQTSGDRYGATYAWSATMRGQADEWERIWESLGEKPEGRRDFHGEPT